MKLIKRYSNRKLYDTEQSTYVTLDEIEQMVKGGEELRIIDNASKEDITRVTLAHIILEQEKARSSKLPLPALRGIIESGEEFIQRLQQPFVQIKDEVRRKTEVVGESGKVLIDLVENTQKSIDEFQKKMDGRLRDTIDQLTHIPEMQIKMRQQEQRIYDLEQQLLTLRRTLSDQQKTSAPYHSPQRNIPEPKPYRH